MLAGRTLEFRLHGARLALCRGRQAHTLRGRALPSERAARVIAELLRRGDTGGRLRALFATHTGSLQLHSVDDAQLLRWLTRQLELPGRDKLMLVELDDAARRARAVQGEPSRAAQIAKAVAQQRPELGHHGRQYRLIAGADQSQAKSRHLFEAVAAREAQSVLLAIAEEAQPGSELTKLLREAAALIAEASQRPRDEALVLLRRERALFTSSSGDQAITPSQLRQAQQPTEWLELRFVDHAGEPMADEAYEVQLADGSVRSGTLDANGCAYLDGLPAGSCAVKFPAYQPKRAS